MEYTIENLQQENREDCLRKLAGDALGLRYDSPGAQKILGQQDWQDYWPIVDGAGLLTGGIVGSEDGYYNVEDLAMVAEEDLPAEERRRVRAEEENGTFDGYANLPS